MCAVMTRRADDPTTQWQVASGGELEHEMIPYVVYVDDDEDLDDQKLRSKDQPEFKAC